MTGSHPTFECPKCARITSDPRDIRHGWCPSCEDWTGDNVILDAPMFCPDSSLLNWGAAHLSDPSERIQP